MVFLMVQIPNEVASGKPKSPHTLVCSVLSSACPQGRPEPSPWHHLFGDPFFTVAFCCRGLRLRANPSTLSLQRNAHWSSWSLKLGGLFETLNTHTGRSHSSHMDIAKMGFLGGSSQTKILIWVPTVHGSNRTPGSSSFVDETFEKHIYSTRQLTTYF